MKSRAQRRADFERQAQKGTRRYAFHASPRYAAPAEADHLIRDRFRKRWCSCWMCSPPVREPTLQEKRFLSTPSTTEG